MKAIKVSGELIAYGPSKVSKWDQMARDFDYITFEKDDGGSIRVDEISAHGNLQQYTSIKCKGTWYIVKSRGKNHLVAYSCGDQTDLCGDVADFGIFNWLAIPIGLFFVALSFVLVCTIYFIPLASKIIEPSVEMIARPFTLKKCQKFLKINEFPMNCQMETY